MVRQRTSRRYVDDRRRSVRSVRRRFPRTSTTAARRYHRARGATRRPPGGDRSTSWIVEDVAAEDAPSLPPPPVVVVGGGERRANAGGTMNGTNAGETEIVVVDDDGDPPPARARRPPPPPGAQRPRAEARLRHLAPAVRYDVDALGSGLYRALCPRLRSVLSRSCDATRGNDDDDGHNGARGTISAFERYLVSDTTIKLRGGQSQVFVGGM